LGKMLLVLCDDSNLKFFLCIDGLDFLHNSTSATDRMNVLAFFHQFHFCESGVRGRFDSSLNSTEPMCVSKLSVNGFYCVFNLGVFGRYA
jgi:hypothetical protein